MKSLPHPRSLAAKLCYEVIDKGVSLDNGLANLPTQLDPRDRSFIQNLSFGVTRWYWHLKSDADALLEKPIRNKDRIVYFILLIGIYQIRHLQIAQHAAVADTVDCCEKLNKKWAKGLINACLRSTLKNNNPAIPLNESEHYYSHPEWMARTLQAAWLTQTDEILANNNLAAPLCLRVNQQKSKRDDYLSLLNNNDENSIATKDPYSNIGIRLKKTTSIQNLPHFESGWASVQDTASQLVLNYLKLEEQDRCLDACAAPGGKTALLLENAPKNVVMHALDIGGERNTKLAETLDRLQLKQEVSILEGSASEPNTWWDGTLYNKILLDAPCTGSGVIRRHPDIKHHRTGEDLDQLMLMQQSILSALWPLLTLGGKLLYTTCSVFPKENEKQITRFINTHAGAKALPIEHPTGLKQTFGIQTLPGISDMDGFYYCLIQKGHE